MFWISMYINTYVWLSFWFIFIWFMHLTISLYDFGKLSSTLITSLFRWLPLACFVAPWTCDSFTYLLVFSLNWNWMFCQTVDTEWYTCCISTHYAHIYIYMCMPVCMFSHFMFSYFPTFSYVSIPVEIVPRISIWKHNVFICPLFNCSYVFIYNVTCFSLLL